MRAGRTFSARLPAAGLCQQRSKDEAFSCLRLSLDADRDGAGLEPRLFAEMNKASNGWPIKTRLVHKPSVSVCMKRTSASSSASDRPKRRTLLVFILAVDSGAGQQVVPSPGSWGWQRGSTSRVL